MVEESAVKIAKLATKFIPNRDKLRIRNDQERCGSICQSWAVVQFDQTVALVAGRPSTVAGGSYRTNGHRNEGLGWIAPRWVRLGTKVTQKFFHVRVPLT